MEIKGIVSGVNKLEGGSDGELYSLSIEGLSLLVSSEVRDLYGLPASAAYIWALAEVRWRKGKRPIWWLKAWAKA